MTCHPTLNPLSATTHPHPTTLGVRILPRCNLNLRHPPQLSNASWARQKILTAARQGFKLDKDQVFGLSPLLFFSTSAFSPSLPVARLESTRLKGILRRRSRWTHSFLRSFSRPLLGFRETSSGGVLLPVFVLLPCVAC